MFKGDAPLLSDFGLGREVGKASTSSEGYSGTIMYSAPEQFDTSKGAVDRRTDIWQAGVLCYELFTGRVPFEGDISSATYAIMNAEPMHPSDVNSEIPRPMGDAILRALRKRKEERWPGCAEMRSALIKASGVDIGEAVMEYVPSRHAKASSPAAESDEPTSAASRHKDRCPACDNHITPENKLLKCKGCGEKLCTTCESWIDKAESHEGRKLSIRFPLCEKCYEKEKEQKIQGIEKQIAEEKRLEAERAEAEKRRIAEEIRLEEERRKAEERELQEILSLVTPGNAVSRQNAWARRLGIPVDWQNSLGMKFKLIPAGEFMMGDERWDDSKPIHKVRITQPFYLGVYQVTQREWEAVMVSNLSNFKGENLPVETVSWEDCQAFVGKLNARDPGKNYRLPTEAEWEHACRAGTTSRFCFGDEESKLGEYAWYSANSGSKTHPVGQKKPNLFGLHDMHGNVWEWCNDWFDENYYKNSPSEDPQGPAQGSDRVYRGGSWINRAVFCAAGDRGRSPPGYRIHDLGVRLVRSL